MTYIIIAAVVSGAGILSYYTYDRFVLSRFGGWSLSLMYWFGWVENGLIVAFFQQFAFLVFVASFIHTLVAIQDKWYGWVADVLIIAVISVFTPIAPLRAALVWFFYLLIFNSNALLQIVFCLVLGAALYVLNKPIFARKVI